MTGALDGAADPVGECGHVVIAGGGPLTAAGMVLRCTMGTAHFPPRDHADEALRPGQPIRWRCSPSCSGLETHYLDGDHGATGEVLP